MFERFTDRARRVCVLAQEEGRLLGHNYIGTEHLLLGLLAVDGGVASTALARLGVSADEARDKVRESVGAAGSEASGPLPYTPRTKKVLELSLREALQLGHNYIGTEHILLGLVREGEGVAAQILVNMGADLSAVRKKVIEILGGGIAPTVEMITPRPRRSSPVEGAVERLADLIYEAWWDGAGHVCADYRCDDCMSNAKVAAAVALARDAA